MALTAYDSMGFEHCRNAAGFPQNAIKYEGSTGTTYTRGTPVVLSAGKLLDLAYNAGPVAALPIVGICAETKTCATDDYMVEVVPVDGNVFTVTFTGQQDVTCNGASTAANQFNIAQSSSLNTSTTAIAGALIYIYEGPGKGNTRTIVDNTTGSSTSATQVTVAPPFSATPTTASLAIMLCDYSSGAWGFPKNIGDLVARSTASGLKTKVAVLDSSTLAMFAIQSVDMANLKMDVTIAPSKAVFGLETTG
jgi:hypothetical protein